MQWMKHMRPSQRTARRHGMRTSYRNYRNEWIQTACDSLRAVLTALVVRSGFTFMWNSLPAAVVVDSNVVFWLGALTCLFRLFQISVCVRSCCLVDVHLFRLRFTLTFFGWRKITLFCRLFKRFFSRSNRKNFTFDFEFSFYRKKNLLIQWCFIENIFMFYKNS